MHTTKPKPKCLFTSTALSVASIKKLGAHKSNANLNTLLELFCQDLDIDLKREVVSSIGRQKDNDRILAFLNQEAFKTHFMEVIYQMLRTCLYKAKTDSRFATLGDQILKHYNNEVMDKMLEYHQHRQHHKSPQRPTPQITKPSLLVGDNRLTLQRIQDQQIQLIFTSPPYYNARVYSDYANYQEYLKHMQETLEQCFRILEDGRFIIINVSPVIVKRAGREFESRRYPIHFDFHSILVQSGFYFLDEIIWIKPEYSVPNRVAGYLQSKKALSYRPNCITESLLVYRKNAPFLIDKNLKRYDKSHKNEGDTDSTNCWYIAPKASKDHPAVFPEELCVRVLKYYSFAGDIVCDPFAGSGTFGKVAQEMGRIPLLCEQNKEYAMRLKQGGFLNLDKLVLERIIDKLLRGLDYREEIINSINVAFLDFALGFFKQILEAKIQDQQLSLEWYKEHFIANENLNSQEIAVYAGINKKTICNIYGSETREIVLEVAQANIDYLENLLNALGESADIGLCLKITYKNISVELNLNESLLVINALATKKIALRGGAWSSVGKKIEKPLMLALCQKCGVQQGFYNADPFSKDKSLSYDREVDFKLYNADQSREYRVEVKLMGKGNPECADAVMARESHIFIADTLSVQNKNQLTAWDVEFLELKGNRDCVGDFKKILKRLGIPYKG